MTDAGIGDQALHIRLRKCQQRAVQDADNAECHSDRRKCPPGVRKEWNEESQESVRPDFEDQPCQIHAAGDRRLRMRIREPGMQGHYRELDGKRHEKRQHQPERRRAGDRRAQQSEIIEGEHPRCAPMYQGKPQYAQQQEQSAKLCEDEEFDGSVMPAFVSPDIDKKI